MTPWLAESEQLLVGYIAAFWIVLLLLAGTGASIGQYELMAILVLLAAGEAFLIRRLRRRERVRVPQ
ncbi:hypothetical protein [Jiangella rhizosphaerae]|uniref:Uncharacterized protein n=1 Tax=Jiangella rhizosphaerae TaxID=2293569 RepID=A0A418KTF2_9ACTN|nr:hypothetical protein [Jiangella rhizosphaerae]RIQ28605.1 hypothetical protein DY240_08810 [Jiangella rhizosphaerae]